MHVNIDDEPKINGKMGDPSEFREKYYIVEVKSYTLVEEDGVKAKYVPAKDGVEAHWEDVPQRVIRKEERTEYLARLDSPPVFCTPGSMKSL